jgi:hypothetical protein
VKTGAPRAGQFSKVLCVAFSPDGTHLATGCADNTARLRNLATFQEVAQLRGHTAYVHALAWSPDGTRLASGSGDFTLRVWDSLTPAATKAGKIARGLSGKPPGPEITWWGIGGRRLKPRQGVWPGPPRPNARPPADHPPAGLTAERSDARVPPGGSRGLNLRCTESQESAFHPVRPEPPPEIRHGITAAVPHPGGRGLRAQQTTAPISQNSANIRIGVSVIPNMAGSAFAMVEWAMASAKGRPVSIVGHSLGGGLAQVVGNWSGCPFISLNGPGMKTHLKMSAFNIFKPRQMYRSIRSKSTGKTAGICFYIANDFVGKYGWAIGTVIKLPAADKSHDVNTIREGLRDKGWLNSPPGDVCPDWPAAG